MSMYKGAVLGSYSASAQKRTGGSGPRTPSVRIGALNGEIKTLCDDINAITSKRSGLLAHEFLDMANAFVETTAGTPKLATIASQVSLNFLAFHMASEKSAMDSVLSAFSQTALSKALRQGRVARTNVSLAESRALILAASGAGDKQKAPTDWALKIPTLDTAANAIPETIHVSPPGGDGPRDKLMKDLALMVYIFLVPQGFKTGGNKKATGLFNGTSLDLRVVEGGVSTLTIYAMLLFYRPRTISAYEAPLDHATKLIHLPTLDDTCVLTPGQVASCISYALEGRDPKEAVCTTRHVDLTGGVAAIRFIRFGTPETVDVVMKAICKPQNYADPNKTVWKASDAAKAAAAAAAAAART